MNSIAIIILLALLIDFLLEIVGDVLNLKRLQPEIPGEFADIFDAERYRRSQEYLRVNTRFGWISSTFDLSVLLAFWFGGGFTALDEWVRGCIFGPVLTGLIYMGVLFLLKTVIDLPFSIYRTFVIEERFGFNKTTWKTFWLDRIKGLALSVVIGGPLLAAVLGFFEFAGGDAWWICWLVVTLFMLLIQFVAPTWIMPLFNKFEPLEDGELRSAIMDYARSVDYPLTNLFVMDGSKRSAKGNAFFTGFGKNKRIALFDTLVERHATGEIVAVLAHEIGHFKKKHVIQGMILGILHMGAVFFLLSFFLTYEPLFHAFYIDEPSAYAGLILFGMLFVPIDLLLGLLIHTLSRKNEYEADRFAAETTRRPDLMVKALKKLAADNLSNLTPHPFYVFLHYSHPPMLERIRALRSIRPAESRGGPACPPK